MTGRLSYKSIKAANVPLFPVKEEAKIGTASSLSAKETLSASKRTLVFGKLRTEGNDLHRHVHPKDLGMCCI